MTTYPDTPLLIDGVWRGGTEGRSIAVVDPATGEAIGKVAHATRVDLDAALEAVDRGFGIWSAVSAYERSKIMRRAADLLRERAETIATIMTREQGKPVAEAKGEVMAAADIIDWFAEESRRAYGQVIPARAPGVTQMAIKLPVGPVAAFTPWNFPINQVVRKLSAALAAGCSIIVKAPEETPASPAELIRAFVDAGVPAGVVNLVYGVPAEISEYLIAHPVIRKISFTGSTPVGKQLAALASQHMKLSTMELGGHAPAIIFDDADIDNAVKVLAASKFRNAGQVCVSPTRFLVQEGVYDRVVTAFTRAAEAIQVGNGLEAGTQMGPLANDRRIPALEALIRDAVDQGADLRTGGRRIGNTGYFFAPTVLANVPRHARIMNEEPFGPVAVFAPFSTRDEAIAEANRLPFGLASYAFTRSSETAHLLGLRIQAGMTTINHNGLALPEVPFGGIKDSGYGTEGGSEAINDQVRLPHGGLTAGSISEEYPMNGADMLCDVLLVNGVDVCFANPGTSEMHFVAALDRKPQMRCVLGLSEGVVTGAADGYARMADKPAATLLHLGPGLANGLANLHNARRARTPMVNIVGDHASYHLQYDAPLTSDIEALARPMSHWVGRAVGARDVRARTEEAFEAALMKRGVATMILPADAAWSEVQPEPLEPVTLPARPTLCPETLKTAGAALRSSKRTVIILAGRALRAAALETAGRIAAATGAALFSQTSDRTERGAGRVAARPVPYNIDLAVAALKEFEVAICLGGRQPVGFFAYPHKPSTMLPPSCAVIELAGHEHDLGEALELLAEEAGVRADAPFVPNSFVQPEIAAPTGALNADSITIAVARSLPENAIICEESITSAGKMAVLAPGLNPHDHIPLTGGAIGEGIPLATGAAIACPDRKVIALQADGSGMYTLQGLWTQARENLDVLTIIFANRAYAILQGEMRNVGVNDFGRNARRMLDLDNPELDWCSLARGMGVEAGRASTIEQFTHLLDAALARKGPFLIEAII